MVFFCFLKLFFTFIELCWWFVCLRMLIIFLFLSFLECHHVVFRRDLGCFCSVIFILIICLIDLLIDFPKLMMVSTTTPIKIHFHRSLLLGKDFIIYLYCALLMAGGKGYHSVMWESPKFCLQWEWDELCSFLLGFKYGYLSVLCESLLW